MVVTQEFTLPNIRQEFREVWLKDSAEGGPVAINELDWKSHWLRENMASKYPRHWVILDSEATTENVSENVKVQKFALAATSNFRQNPKTGEFSEEKLNIWTSTKNLWLSITDSIKKNARCIIVAHNVGYDLRICNAFADLPSLGYFLSDICIDDYVSFARFTNREQKKSIVFIDSMTWWPYKLEEIALWIGKGKIPVQWREKVSDELLKKRCLKDVEILQSAWQQLLIYLQASDHGNFAMTGAGQGWNSWRHNYYGDKLNGKLNKVLIHNNLELREKERAAAFCGRAEAYRYGTFTNVSELDLQNAYGEILANYSLPVQYIGQSDSRSEFRSLPNIIKLCEVEVETDEELVPYKNDVHGVIWPVGKFNTVLWQPEIELLLFHGQQVKIKKTYAYRSSPILAEWAQKTMLVMEESSPLIKYTLKHWLRSIVGKSGTRYSAWEDFAQDSSEEIRIAKYHDEESDVTGTLLFTGDGIKLSTKINEGENSCPQIMGFVMSQLRVQLWEMMEFIGLDKILYCDTDGVLVENGCDQDKYRIKSIIRNLEIFGPKKIIKNNQHAVSGIPKKADRLSETEFKGESWQQSKSSLSSGNSGEIKIVTRKYTMRVEDPRRIRVGSLSRPIEIS